MTQLPYGYITYAEARQALADRLSDSGKVFWTDTELGLYLLEALRTWNALTSYWRDDFTFTPQQNVAWYDLTDLVGMPNTLRSLTLLDTDLYAIIQAHLLEPLTWNPWTGSSVQFSASDLVGAFARVRDEVLAAAGPRISRRLVPAVAGRIVLPDSVIDLRRIAYLPARPSPVTPPSLTTLPLSIISPVSTIDPLTGIALVLDLGATGKVTIIDLTSSPPAILRSGNLTLSSYTDANSIIGPTYLNNKFYLGNQKAVGTTTVGLLEFDGTTFLPTGNRVVLAPNNLIANLPDPKSQAVARINGTPYFVYADSNYGSQQMGVVRLSDYTLLGKASIAALLPTRISGSTGSVSPIYPIIDAVHGQVYFVYAYHPTLALYGFPTHAPTNWRIIRVNLLGPVVGGLFTDTQTWEFLADADGNCGIAGFIDTANNRLVIPCNLGAIKLFDIGSGTVTLTVGSLAAPATSAGDEFPNDRNGIHNVGTMGYPFISGGQAASGLFLQTNVSDPFDPSFAQQSELILDVRQALDLSVKSTIDLQTLLGLVGTVGGNFNFLACAYWQASKTLLYFTRTDFTHVYLISLGSAAGVPVASSASSQASVMFPEDTWAEQSFQPDYTLTPAGTPESYLQSTQPPISFDTDKPPASAGQYELLTIEAGPSASQQVPTSILIPDDWAWVIKWGMLADLLSRESSAKDLTRAAYCQARYKLGLRLLSEASALLAIRLNGVPLQIDAVRSADFYRNTWEAESPGTPEISLHAGLNLLALAPPPDAGPYSLTLTVVRNAPLPVADTDTVQVGRDDLDALLDYSQHLAAFKQGGTEFSRTSPLLQRFFDQASLYGFKLAELGEFSSVLFAQSQREAEVNPRMAPST